MTDTPRDWADEIAHAIYDLHKWDDSGIEMPAAIAAALREVRATPGVYARDGDVFRCSVDISVKQAASFAGGIDEFVRLCMEQAASSMADRIRAAAEAARDAKGGG